MRNGRHETDQEERKAVPAGLPSDLPMVESDLHADQPFDNAELEAIIRLLGPDLDRLFG